MAVNKAIISRVNQLTGIAEIAYQSDKYERNRPNVRLPQPYAGLGWGILAGIEIGTPLIVSEDPDGKPHILGYFTNDKYFGESLEAASGDLGTTFQLEPKYKQLKEGEIALQSKSNSLVFLNDQGGINLSTSDGCLFEVNKNTDSINQISLSSNIITEAASVRNGLIKRDLRTEQQKIEDLFLDSLLQEDFSFQQDYDIVGVDSQYNITDNIDKYTGIFDTTEGINPILEIAGIKQTPEADKTTRNIKNPSLVEYRIDAHEFSDGISSLSLSEEKQRLLEGRLPLNLAGRFIIGTVVDENGLMPRFDYVFGSGNSKGHGEIWKLPAINETNVSVDFKIDSSKTITSSAVLGNKSQWISSGIDRFNTAQAFQLVLNTRGADNAGKIPDAKSIGSRWGLMVDKEGLTKWNIPAATSLNNKELFRAGRSLLWNLDGSITQSVGKEKSTILKNITGLLKDREFVNIQPTREDRSWTGDFEGNIEWKVGKDGAGQSIMIDSDGGLAFYFGKHTSNKDSVVKDVKVAGLTSPSKSRRRIGTSISGKTDGSIELNIGTDVNAQSIALNAGGVISISINKDEVNDSFLLNTTGNIKLKGPNGTSIELLGQSVNGGLTTFENGIIVKSGIGSNVNFIQIDKNNTITLKNASSATITMSNGSVTATNMTGNKIALTATGSVSLGGTAASIEIDPIAGIILRTPGGSISLNSVGKVEMAANTGLTVTGPFAHLNNTAIAFGPAAATSPYNIAAIGPGSLDPLTGNPCSVGGFPAMRGG